ncbi:MAG: hypothetical protein ACI31R_00895 [Bacilli bacterium]
MSVELEILKVLIDNKEKIIKKNGWGSHKIYRCIGSYSKEEIKIALDSLIDKNLIKSTLVKNGDIKDYIYRINESGIEFYNRESDNMNIISNIEKMINDDIKKLDDVNLMDYEQKKDYYIELTSKYHNVINGFGNSLYGYYKDMGFYNEDIDKESLKINFKRIKTMLITFKANGFKNFDDKKLNQPIINNTMTSINNNSNINTNNNDINVTFESVRENIKKMDSINDAELKEILLKIDKIEEILKSKDTKRDKWNKLKPLLLWVTDKGADVAISLLPLFLQFK